MSHHIDELFAALQRLIPQHALSRLLGKIADCENTTLKNALIRAAVRHYGIDLSEAREPEPERYPSFNAFFTRHLSDSARPIDPSNNGLASPADGTVSQFGTIENGQLIQAKGFHFDLTRLLGPLESDISCLEAGSFATIYLSPRDYHRVHMPCDGTLLETLYIPGKLFSVNDTTTRYIPGLFSRNERLVCWFDSPMGKIAVVLVGALFVAGIGTVWQDSYSPRHLQHQRFESPTSYVKGQEIGHFRFGSTVIVATEKTLAFDSALKNGETVRMGSLLARFTQQ
ncbi:MAG: phosphatidylserine decarboxylase [Porticoccaceae bacterium]|nr:phosphatidylserine decarboxylase [Porticoccaceae bacterium]